MGELQSAIDVLAAEELKPMFGPQLLERLRPLLVLQNRIAAEVTRTVRECELTGAAEHDGLKTMQSWLRGHARLSAGAASRLVAGGRGVGEPPAGGGGVGRGGGGAGEGGGISPVPPGPHPGGAGPAGGRPARGD